MMVPRGLLCSISFRAACNRSVNTCVVFRQVLTDNAFVTVVLAVMMEGIENLT